MRVDGPGPHVAAFHGLGELHVYPCDIGREDGGAGAVAYRKDLQEVFVSIGAIRES